MILTNADDTAVYLADFVLATEKTIVDEHGCGTEYYMNPGRRSLYPLCGKLARLGLDFAQATSLPSMTEQDGATEAI